MITQIGSLSGNTAGFNLIGTITKEDYDNVVLPVIKEKTNQFQTINLMLVINTDLSDFTPGAWLKDVTMGIKNITRFHRVALVSDSAVVRGITATADKIVPGEYKTFQMKDLDNAKMWVAGGLTSAVA